MNTGFANAIFQKALSLPARGCYVAIILKTKTAKYPYPNLLVLLTSETAATIGQQSTHNVRGNLG